MSKYAVVSGLYFPVFGLSTKIYTKIFLKTNISYSLIRAYQGVSNVSFQKNFGVNFRTQSKFGKTGPDKTLHLEIFHAVYMTNVS